MSAPVVVVVAQPMVDSKYIVPAQQEEVGRWAIDLCEVGNCCTCCYACCCSSCAVGSIKSGLDGSNCLVACCCFSVPALRFLTRTAYGIEGNAHYDCWTGIFCSVCALNQMLQTVQQKGKVNIAQVGTEFNLNERVGCQQRSCPNITYDVFYALFCAPCANGYIMQSAGVPCWFGALCFNAFSANNTLRYHNRTRPCCNNELFVDCCIPGLFVIMNDFTYGASQPLGGFAYTLGNLIEENHRHGRESCYGLNIFACLLGFCGWCFTCTCEQEEGRYLVKATPVVY